MAQMIRPAALDLIVSKSFEKKSKTLNDEVNVFITNAVVKQVFETEKLTIITIVKKTNLSMH